MNRRLLYTIAVVSCISFVTAPSIIMANIKRTCKAHYEVRFIEINKKNVTEDISTTFGQFSARRGCGRMVPNRCRRRARDAAQLCMSKHWQNFNISYNPKECRTNGVRDYHIANLQQGLKDTVCRFMVKRNPDYHNATVSIHAVTYGNKNCGPRDSKKMTVELSGHYYFDCKR